jgi:hypothetical protein
MTTFAEPAPIVEPKRDRYGRYLISPADGGKAVAHTRATTFVKAVAEESALTKWAARMTALGLAARPDLLAGVAAIADPSTPDAKKSLNAICEDAKTAGGGDASRNLGTAIHAEVEQINRGKDPATSPELFRTDIDAYVTALRSAGVGVYPEMVERVVVNSAWTVAGTFDLLASVPGFELPMVADLKTGASVDFGQGEWAIQLALYATATSLYDYSSDTHQPFPAVDQERGLIIHLPAGTGRCDLYIIDLAAGRRMIDTCATVRAWRNQSRRLLTPLTIPPAAPEGQATTAMAPDPAPLAAPSPVLAPIPSPVRPSGPTEDALVDARVQHLFGRLSALQAANPDAITEVLRRWPADTCTLSDHLAGHGALLPWQLDQIEQATSAVEASVEAPFYAEVDPASRGIDFDDNAIQATIAAIKALPADLRAQVQTAARDAGVPKFTERPTVAQLDQVIALVETAEMAWADRVRLAVTSIQWIEQQAGLGSYIDTNSLLAMVGATFDAEADRWPLTEGHVRLLSDIGDGIGLGVLVIVDGHLEVSPDALDTLTTFYAGKRPLLTAARLAAETFGLPKPGKSIDIATSIPLVAHLAVADGTTPST